MAKVMTDESNYSAIAGAIRSKLGVSTRYKPSEMAAAISSISGVSSSDNGKVVVDGQLTQQTSRSVSQNGTYDTTTNNEVVVSVSGGDGDNPFALTEYIESSGTQYIDTGYLVKDSSRFELVANVDSSSAAYACPFGTRASGGDNASAGSCLVFAKYSGNTMRANWGSDAYEPVGAGVAYGRKSEFVLVKGNVIVATGDGLTAATVFNSTASATATHPMHLFNLDQGGSSYGSVTACKMKLYRFRVYEDDTLVMELLPYEDNGEACLKDSVTGNLFKNAGTGSFVLGTD